ncbi:hypothetical protein MMC27_005422 [Xylographa pallens]|nr:hypothetical protein [Xylographa pallens]
MTSSFPDLLVSCSKSKNKDQVTTEFSDGTFIFHSQWLHDACRTDGPSRNIDTAFCQSTSTSYAAKVQISGHGIDQALNVTWDSGKTSKFPSTWLRAIAPVVASSKNHPSLDQPPLPDGWLVATLKIPEISYRDIFPKDASPELRDDIRLRVMDAVIGTGDPGIIKVVDLPAPNIEQERGTRSNIVTSIVKQLFGSTWVHPRRDADTTFNVSSHSDDLNRAELPNYDTNQSLLPHTDHAMYDQPIQIMGFYGLEGKSENTWVSAPAVLKTLRDEDPRLFAELVHKAPMTVGRVTRIYGEPLYQGTVGSAIITESGFPDRFKRVRWHPNNIGFLTAPYNEFKEARLAHQKFQEIMRRDTHQLKLVLKPGDMYIWDNFRLLHGRERVLEVPRTGVGQTVSEQVVADMYRDIRIRRLKRYVDEKWLVHLPASQLREMAKIVETGLGRTL